MRLLAESGSSKTDWRLLHEDGSTQALETTSGYNPNVIGPDALRRLLEAELLPQLDDQPPEKLIFYGPGLRSEAMRAQMHASLAALFPSAGIDVQHDLTAAARATGLNARFIVLILGTGSNSALIQDGEIVREIGGEGYLIGDDGSGFDIGRRLLKFLLNGQADDQLYQGFLGATGMTPIAYRDWVMHQPRPNRIVAQLTHLVHQFRHHKPVTDLVTDAFDTFIRHTVLNYPSPRRAPIAAVGGVAHTFQDLLARVLQTYDLTLKTVIPRPIDGLVTYHGKH